VEAAEDGKASTVQIQEFAGVATENIVATTAVQLVVWFRYIQAAVLVLCTALVLVLTELPYIQLLEDTLGFRVVDVMIQASMVTTLDHQLLTLTQV
jgi:hypothetical protein